MDPKPNPSLAPNGLKLLTEKQTCAKWMCGRETLRRRVKAKLVPPPVKISSKCIRYLEHEQDEAIARYMRQRGEPAQAA